MRSATLLLSLLLLPAAAQAQACVEDVRALIDESLPYATAAVLITPDGLGHVGQGRRSPVGNTMQFFWSATTGLRTVEITPGQPVNLGLSSADGAFVIASNPIPDRPPLRWETATGTVLEMGVPAGAERFAVTGVTEEGAVYGFAFNLPGSGQDFVGSYRWTPGTGFVLVSDTYRIEEVSNDGSVWLGTDVDGNGLPYLRRAGTWTPLEGFPPDAVSWFASDLSGDGRYVTGRFAYANRTTEAFRWTNGTVTAMPGWTPGSYDRGEYVANDGTVIAWQDDEYVRWVGNSVQPLYDVLVGNGLDPALVLGYFGMGPPGSSDEGEVGGYSDDGRVLVASEDYRRAVRLDGGCAVGIAARPNLFQGATLQGGETALFSWEVSGLGLSDQVTIEWSPDGTTYNPVATVPALQIEEDDEIIRGKYEWTVPPVNAEAAFLRLTAPGAEELIGPFAIESEVSLALLSPPADTLLLPYGDPYTVQWEASDAVGNVDLVLLPDTLGSAEIVLDIALTGDRFAWTVPDTLFSRSARLVVSSAANVLVADTSAFFRIKPYHLARVSEDGARYVPFDVDRHAWPFCNCREHLFPDVWWGLSQFDYPAGTDPFSEDEYDNDFPDPPINARSDYFPDWPAFVRAFGTDAAYHAIVTGVEAFYRDSFTARWGGFHGQDGWGGSCSGMALSALMAFADREAFGERYPEIGAIEELFTVPISPEVREAVNTLYTYWIGADQRAYRIANSTATQTPRQTLADLKARLLSDDRRGDGYLYISNVGGSGAHAVAPYRLRPDPGNADRTWVYVYDPNKPGRDDTYVVIDSTANTWFYTEIGSGGWGGATGMYVMDRIDHYFQDAVVPLLPLSTDGQRVPAGGDRLRVAPTQGATVEVVPMDGSGRVGYADGAVVNTLDGAVADIPPVGGPTPPIGYDLPRGTYRLALAGAPDSLLSATVFDAARVFAYGRADAEVAHTDHLAYDPDAQNGILTVRSDDAGATKRLTLRAIDTTEDARERTLDVRDLTLTGADSVRFAAPDAPEGPRLVLTNEGGAKSYTVRLRTASAEGATRFAYAGVALEAGATHTVRPDWSTLATATLEIDRDGDGVPEESVPLANEVAGEGDAPEALPTGVTLAAVYPNPAQASATVRYGLPEASAVRLTVVDVLGRRVAVLVDGAQAAGWHEAVFGGTTLPSGVYVVRLEADGTAMTRRLTIVR